MPLLQANLAHQYQSTFWTVSGFKCDPPPLFKDYLRQYFCEQFPNHKNIVVAYEVSDTGFRHYHIGLETHTPSRVKKPVNQLRLTLRKQSVVNDVGVHIALDFVDPKSIQVYVAVVPKGGELGPDGVHSIGFDVVRKYLKNPTKEKTVDGTLVIEFDDKRSWNVYRYMATLEPNGLEFRIAEKIARFWKEKAPPEAGPLTFRQYQSYAWRSLAPQHWYESDLAW